MNSSGPANRLAAEKSPYLLQHAQNPVDWYPFGEEAFAEARASDRIIFLSIGYSTCHWCHVMERESFENPQIAAIMNESFINVKVDREERPDVDQIYMQSVLMLAGQGGWPLSLWLTPDLKPFYGGTYFPPDQRYGRPGFGEVCQWLAKLWREKRHEVLTHGETLMEKLREGAPGGSAKEGEETDGSALAATARRDLAQAYDTTYGGFGGAPKFPRPSTLAFLVHHASREDDATALRMVEHTLEMMWRGGLYDHVGGGFARYSTDAKWLVPHFEKMLYDNAQLIEIYLDLHLRSGRADFAGIIEDTLEWVAREMTDERGGFYSAQDADSEGVEGKFYVFSPDELNEALGEEDARFLSAVHGVTEEGNFEGKSILFWPESVAETAAGLGLDEESLRTRHAAVRKRLYDWREQRIRPGLDDKVIASWNGLMIAAMARAGRILESKRWIDAATRAAEFIADEMIDEDGTLLRRWREGEGRYEGSLDDYGFVAYGYFTLWSCTGDLRWLRGARNLMNQIESRFRDEDGAYWFAEERSDLIVRLKESYDGALPSSNGMQALLLARFGAVAHDQERGAAIQTLASNFGADLKRSPEGHPVQLMALREADEAPRTLTVFGAAGSSEFERLLTAAHRHFAPGTVVVPMTTGDAAELGELGVDAGPAQATDGSVASAMLCENATCRPFEA